MDEQKLRKALDEIFKQVNPLEWKSENHWRRWNRFFLDKRNQESMHSLLTGIVEDLERVGERVNLLSFINHPKAMAKMDGEQDYYGLLTLYFYAMMLVRSGWIYRVHPNLAYLLAKTTLTNVKSDMIRVPYPVMFIEIPKTVGLQVYNWETGWHDVEGVYLIEEENTENFKRVLRVCVVGQSKTHNPFDDASIVYFISLDDENIEDSIADSNEKLAQKCKPSEREHQRQSMPKLFSFVMNVLLYITSVDADVIKTFNPSYQKLRKKMLKTKNKKVRRKLSAQLGNSDPEMVHVLGSQIVIDGKSPLGDRAESQKGDGEQRRVAVRTWVAGHWQGYWIGPKGNQKKIGKWKKPYCRGPELAEVIRQRTYDVRQSRSDGENECNQ